MPLLVAAGRHQVAVGGDQRAMRTGDQRVIGVNRPARAGRRPGREKALLFGNGFDDQGCGLVQMGRRVEAREIGQDGIVVGRNCAHRRADRAYRPGYFSTSVTSSEQSPASARRR